MNLGRNSITTVKWSHSGIYKYCEMGEYIRVNNGVTIIIDGDLHKQIASRTKPNTDWIRQHLFMNLERARFKVVEVNNWKGCDDE